MKKMNLLLGLTLISSITINNQIIANPDDKKNPNCQTQNNTLFNSLRTLTSNVCYVIMNKAKDTATFLDQHELQFTKIDTSVELNTSKHFYKKEGTIDKNGNCAFATERGGVMQVGKLGKVKVAGKGAVKINDSTGSTALTGKIEEQLKIPGIKAGQLSVTPEVSTSQQIQKGFGDSGKDEMVIRQRTGGNFAFSMIPSISTIFQLPTFSFKGGSEVLSKAPIRDMEKSEMKKGVYFGSAFNVGFGPISFNAQAIGSAHFQPLTPAQQIERAQKMEAIILYQLNNF